MKAGQNCHNRAHLIISIHLDADVSEEVVYALLVAVLGRDEGRPQLCRRLPRVEEHEALHVDEVEGALQHLLGD